MNGDGDASNIQIVIYASVHSFSGASLNDIICVDPKLQTDIYIYLLRFVWEKNLSNLSLLLT